VRGDVSSPGGYGVLGYISSSTATGAAVRGDTSSANAKGVLGVNTNSVGGYAVMGDASASGIGVYGRSEAGAGISGISVNGDVGVGGGGPLRGVYGTSPAYGIYGASGGGGTAVYASGNLTASGFKQFRIDHPRDPEHAYLVHYATESPSPQNFYVGNVVTDDKGYAWVDLPEYFEDINTNVKYQLTVVSGGRDFVQAMVSREVEGNRFQVRTSAPRTKVSWRVDADRNDLYARRHRPTDVLQKGPREVGTYANPDVYGFGPDRGIFKDKPLSQWGGNVTGRP